MGNVIASFLKEASENSTKILKKHCDALDYCLESERYKGFCDETGFYIFRLLVKTIDVLYRSKPKLFAITKDEYRYKEKYGKNHESKLDLYISEFESMLIYYAECCLGLGKNVLVNSSFRKSIFCKLISLLGVTFRTSKNGKIEWRRFGGAEFSVLNLNSENPKYYLLESLYSNFLNAYPNIIKVDSVGNYLDFKQFTERKDLGPEYKARYNEEKERIYNSTTECCIKRSKNDSKKIIRECSQIGYVISEKFNSNSIKTILPCNKKIEVEKEDDINFCENIGGYECNSYREERSINDLIEKAKKKRNVDNNSKTKSSTKTIDSQGEIV